MTQPTTPTRADGPRRSLGARHLLLAFAVVVGAATTTVASDVRSASASVTSNDWLGIVNAYRAQSGLAPVVEEPSWSLGGQRHSCWMLLNGIAHDEAPGTPGYTVEGDAAGNNGNVAVSSSALATARSHIDLWMTGPFHAIGLLRSSLTRSGFGMCANANNTATPWRSGATLDVIRGINGTIRRTAPVVFPGNGASTNLTRFIAETPDPRSFCGWSGRTVGLPLIALMTSRFGRAGASLSGPGGPVQTCVLTSANTTGTASSILAGDNAVVVVPAAPLTAGVYRASVSTDNGQTVDWSFTVDPNAVLGGSTPSVPLPVTSPVGSDSPYQPVSPFRFLDTRVGLRSTWIPANKQVRIAVAGQAGLPADVSAISANFTVDRPAAPGFLTASNCAESRPSVATLNYTAGDIIGNQSIVPLDRGHLCLFSPVATHLIIDVNGYVSPAASQRFAAVTPRRLIDTRDTVAVRPGRVLRIDVEGGLSPAPDAATAVAVNLTATRTSGDGWIRAYPCDATEPTVSSLNVFAGRDRGNSALVPTASDGTICVTSNVTTHLVVDITGWFGDGGARRFVPLTPLRLVDTRSADVSLNAGRGAIPLRAGEIMRVRVASTRGIPSDAGAASLNLVALGSPVGGWLRTVPCGTSSDVSNLNFPGVVPVANGAHVLLDAQGDVCITANVSTHVVIDVTGVWR